MATLVRLASCAFDGRTVGMVGTAGAMQLLCSACSLKGAVFLDRKCRLPTIVLYEGVAAVTCATCTWAMPLAPGHAIICGEKWRDLPWNAAVPLTRAENSCDKYEGRHVTPPEAHKAGKP